MGILSRDGWSGAEEAWNLHTPGWDKSACIPIVIHQPRTPDAVSFPKTSANPGTFLRLTIRDHLVVQWLGRRTCDQQVVSSTPSSALLG